MTIIETLRLGVLIVLIASGTFFMFLAGLGILRMPDVYTRMHASTKAASLGAGLILIAAAIYFGDLAVVTRALLTTFFIFLTAPVAAHMLGRSAYFLGVPRWKKTVMDEMEHNIDHRDGTVNSPASLLTACPGLTEDKKKTEERLPEEAQ
jgi:multicomponent Na+:H+ antiporter subunit G